MVVRRSILVVLAWLAASAAIAEEVTIAEYAASGPSRQASYSDYIAGVLRESHPSLTGLALKACLDDIARFPNNQALQVHAAAVMCANH